VAAENKLGFPARKSEIQCFWWSARKIFRVVPRKVDGRSFAAVVKMDRGWDVGASRGRGLNLRPGRGSGRFGGSHPFNPDLSNMREGKLTGEGGTTRRVKLKAIRDMEQELNQLGHTITNAS
jgi:hypothetical protein